MEAQREAITITMKTLQQELWQPHFCSSFHLFVFYSATPKWSVLYEKVKSIFPIESYIAYRKSFIKPTWYSCYLLQYPLQTTSPKPFSSLYVIKIALFTSPLLNYNVTNKLKGPVRSLHLQKTFSVLHDQLKKSFFFMSAVYVPH